MSLDSLLPVRSHSPVQTARLRPSRTPLGAARAHVSAERERDGHGHGMSENRKPKRERSLPYDDKRDDKQPYAGEVEDYSGGGVANPPDVQTDEDQTGGKA